MEVVKGHDVLLLVIMCVIGGCSSRAGDSEGSLYADAQSTSQRLELLRRTGGVYPDFSELEDSLLVGFCERHDIAVEYRLCDGGRSYELLVSPKTRTCAVLGSPGEVRAYLLTPKVISIAVVPHEVPLPLSLGMDLEWETVHSPP